MRFRSFVACFLACALAINPALAAEKTPEPSKRQLKLNAQIRNLTAPMLVRNERLLSEIEAIGYRLSPSQAGETGAPGYCYRVLHHDTPQAFSVAPRDVYLTTGLLDLCSEESDLAVVLAREFYFLQDQDRAASLVRDQSSLARTLYVLGFLADVALVTVSMFHQVEAEPESYYDTSGRTNLSTYAIGALCFMPYSITQMAQRTRMRGSHMAPRLRFGRVKNADLMGDTDAAELDALLMTLANFGESAESELAADRAAASVVLDAGYRYDALVSVLEKFASIQTLERSRLNSAAPGLEERLRLADEEASRNAHGR